MLDVREINWEYFQCRKQGKLTKSSVSVTCKGGVVFLGYLFIMESSLKLVWLLARRHVSKPCDILPEPTVHAKRLSLLCLLVRHDDTSLCVALLQYMWRICKELL